MLSGTDLCRYVHHPHHSRFSKRSQETEISFGIWNFRRPLAGGDRRRVLLYSAPPMDRYFGFVVLVSFAAITAGAMLAISQWLGPRRRGRVHDMPFECGVEPRQIVRGRFSVKFFIVALLFVLFDIELIFLFAWAVIYKELGLFGFTEMLIFLLVVLSGLFYSVKRGAFQWK